MESALCFYQNATLLHVKYKANSYVSSDWWHGISNSIVRFHENRPTPSLLTAPVASAPDTRTKKKKYVDLDDAYEQCTFVATQAQAQGQAAQSSAIPLSARVEAELAAYKAIIYEKTNPKHKSEQLSFWLENQHQFPLMNDYALVVLSTQASEAESERLFSTSGRILVPSRAGTRVES